MQKNFTPIVWAYQSFKGEKQIDIIFNVNYLLNPCNHLTKLFDELEKKLPELPENVLKNILEKVK